jgi:hypothetical protein
VRYDINTLSYALKGFYSRNVNYEESSTNSYGLLEVFWKDTQLENLGTLEEDTSLHRCRSSATFKHPNYVRINSTVT